MPAIASLEDLRAAREDLMEAKDLNELKGMWGITNCDTHSAIPASPKLKRRRAQSAFGMAPEQLKGEGNQ